MIILTLQGHLRARQAEWLTSGIMFLWGVVLLHPADTFATTASFSWFARSGVPYAEADQTLG